MTVEAEDRDVVLGLSSAGQAMLEQAKREGGPGGARAPRLSPLVAELFILTKDLQIVRLGDVWNYAQQDFLSKAEKQLKRRGRIRICVLKARQIGISTIIEAIAFVMSMMYDNFNSKIVSHEDKSAKAILGMTKRYWSTYIFKEFHTETFNGQNHLAWTNGSDMDIATAKNVGAGRSQTIQFLHASEVAFWPDPETLMTGLNQSIPTFGLNCIFQESTANGVGNYFHRLCNEAMKGENEYEFVFYPWHEHPEYTAAFIEDDEIAKFSLKDLDEAEARWKRGETVSPEHEEELQLRHKFGIDDARLMWRRWAIINRCQGSIDKFHQEYPTTPHEAFISTGRNVFPLVKMLSHYEPLIPRKGRLIKAGGKLRFVDDPGGWLSVFAEPSDDQQWGVYLLGADPTHTTAGDNACVQIINRRTLEQVAVYRRKIDPINFGKDLQMIGNWYNEGLLAPEATGPGYATIGCIVGDNYPYVYVRQNVAKMQGFSTQGVYGWVTGEQTKHLAISHLLKAVMDPLVEVGGQTYGLLIHDEETFIEMRDYVTTEEGRGYENSDGSEYDDGVMAFAIAIAVHNIEPPPAAYQEIPSHEQPKRVSSIKHAEANATGPQVTGGPIELTTATENRVGTPAADYDSIELQKGPLPKLDGFPEDFEDDVAPWEDWKDGAGI